MTFNFFFFFELCNRNFCAFSHFFFFFSHRNCVTTGNTVTKFRLNWREKKKTHTFPDKRKTKIEQHQIDNLRESSNDLLFREFIGRTNKFIWWQFSPLFYYKARIFNLRFKHLNMQTEKPNCSMATYNSFYPPCCSLFSTSVRVCMYTL